MRSFGGSYAAIRSMVNFDQGPWYSAVSSAFADQIDMASNVAPFYPEAIGGAEVVSRAYRAAFEAGYRWHEFGDSHLLLRSQAAPSSADR